MPEHDAARPGAADPGCLHEGPAADAEGGSARQPEEDRELEDGERDDHVDCARPEPGDERQGEDEHREGLDHVHRPQHPFADELAEAARAGREHAERDAEGHCEEGRDERDVEVDPRRRDRTREDVAAVLIRAEPVVA